MGHKENVIELLKEHKLGLTYKDLLEKYEKKFGYTLWGKESEKLDKKGKRYDNRKNGYYYLKMLIDKGLVKNYTPEDRKGKIVAYKLTEKGLTGEPNDSDIILIEALKLYDDLFKENVDYIMKNEKMVNQIIKNSEKFDKIDKVIN